MNRFIASFTLAEQRIILFVLATLGVGYGILQYNKSTQSTLSFNLSEVQHHMPRMPEAVLPIGMNSAGLVDINIADGEVLETLPGIGPSLATAIIRHRESVGSIRSMDDLDKVPGIGPSMMAKLAPMVTFESVTTATMVSAPPAAARSHSSLPRSFPETNSIISPSEPQYNTIDINTASAEELDNLIGVGPALAERIIEDRYKNGPFAEPNDLERVSGIGPSILKKNKGMIRVE